MEPITEEWFLVYAQIRGRWVRIAAVTSQDHVEAIIADLGRDALQTRVVPCRVMIDPATVPA